ncbi:Endonuclease/exonuclease/phosphatase [Gorgonomyces haynaldii]|nr:Endonuclease/exonuclease/phosphatase [Gorgonomyces haynaldii]
MFCLPCCRKRSAIYPEEYYVLDESSSNRSSLPGSIPEQTEPHQRRLSATLAQLISATQIKKSISALFGETIKLPEDPLKIYVLTWNLGGKSPFESPHLLLGDPSGPLDTKPYGDCHLIVVGTQECGKIEQSMIQSNQTKEWSQMLGQHFDRDYDKVKSDQLVAMHLVVYVKKQHRHMIKNITSAKLGTGIGNMLGNKGAVGISILFGDTSLLFVNCHFSAHATKVQYRNKDFLRINEDLGLYGFNEHDARQKRLCDRYDHVFWFGDLNYRVLGPRGMVDRLLDQGKMDVLFQLDELNIEMQRGSVFQNFQEAPIHFRPTYKYDIGTNTFDTSHKQRVPSWTDRILYTQPKHSILRNPFQKKTTVQCELYKSCDILHSDHRPVYGIYSIDLPPGWLKSNNT